MSIKSYIINEKYVGSFASAVVLQDGNVSFKKDSKSKLYIADVSGDEIEIPESIKALEMNISAVSEEKAIAPEAPSIPGLPDADENTIDLLLRLQMNEKMDEDKIPLIYEEITKAIESAIKRIEE
jgi:hypothetical protein